MSTELSARSSNLALSENEVQALLEDKTPVTLISLTDKIATAYSGQALKSTDTQATEQIFRLLMRDTELRVRVSLAEHVKNSRQLPRDIALTMARDVEEVALPILQHSEVLSDTDLIELINNTDEITRYMAVSKREQVSNVVSGMLLSKGNDEVAQSLVTNKGAEISNDGLEKIVELFPHNEGLMKAVTNRPHVPAAVLEKMINKVSNSLAETLKEKYKKPSKEIDAEVEKTREKETLKLVGMSRTQEEVDKLVDQLQSFNRLTPSIILSALCQGNFCFFETSLARLSNIPIPNARSLINDRGDLGFRALYNKSGLSDTMFPAVRVLLKTVRDLDGIAEKIGPVRYANKVVEKLLKHSQADPVDNLSYIIALVRQVAQ